MPFFATVTIALTLACCSVALAQVQHRHGPVAQEQTNAGDSFDAQMGAAMERMHRDMATAPTGDPDRDFAAMMIPHHQGAIDMARIQLQFGKDPVLRRLAQGIIVEQLQEIEVMRRQLEQLTPRPGRPAPSPHSPSSHKDH